MSLKVSGGGCPRPAARAPGSGLLPPCALVSGRGEWCGPSLPPPSLLLPGQGGVQGCDAVMLALTALGDSCGLGWKWGGLAGVCSGPDPSKPVVVSVAGSWG